LPSKLLLSQIIGSLYFSLFSNERLFDHARKPIAWKGGSQAVARSRRHS